MLREHRHLIVRAKIENSPNNDLELKDWISDVVISVGMNVVSGPHIFYSSMEGNKGYTGIAILDFSHISIHAWDECNPKFIEFDIFSCKNFDINIILEKLNKYKLISYNMMYIDRDKHFGKTPKLFLCYRSTNKISNVSYIGIYSFTELNENFCPWHPELYKSIQHNFDVEVLKFFHTYDEAEQYRVFEIKNRR